MNDNYKKDVIKQSLDKNNEIQTLEKVKNLVENGADINYNIPNMVYPMGDTPLMWAIYKGLSKVAKYLIDNGADLTLTNKLGQRAYHWALSSGNLELAEYIKSREPKNFHNLDLKTQQFKEFGCSQSMIDFFMQKDNNIQTNYGVVKFYYITDIHTFNYAVALSSMYSEIPQSIFDYNNHEFLTLSIEVADYPSLILLWSKDLKTICHYDYEHGELFSLCTWQDFQSNMIDILNDFLSFNKLGKHIGDWFSVEDENGNTPRGDIYWENL